MDKNVILIVLFLFFCSAALMFTGSRRGKIPMMIAALALIFLAVVLLVCAKFLIA